MRSIGSKQFAGFIFTSVTGTLLHYLFDWCNQSRIIALFSGVNESTWEHMKLLFFPLLIFAIIEYRAVKGEYENFWFVKLIGTAVGISVIPIIYYTYQGIFGVNADWFNILIFFIAAATAYLVETKLFSSYLRFTFSEKASVIALAVIALLFFIFTFFPPKIPIFMN